MNDERDEAAGTDAESEAAEVAASSEAASPGDTRQTLTSDDFLVPGPSPESNAGLARWGLTWLAFSIALILLMLCVSFACLTLANWTGFA